MRPEDEPIRYTSIKNPEWVDTSYQAIICTVKFEHTPQEEEFVATRHDPMPYGREIFERCYNLEFGWITIAKEDRIRHLIRIDGEPESYLIGDVYSNSPDAVLQSYIRRHNRENRSGSETGTVIACGSILDHILTRLLEQNGITKSMTLHQRIERVNQENIITYDEYNNLTLMRKIRNDFGHEHEVLLIDEPRKTQCEQLYEAVIGDGRTPSLRLRFSSACMGMMAVLMARINP